ncbi:hypothetical protein Dimus_027802 [Dionaea muscipula]
MGGYIEGRIKISGYPKKQETFTRISGYCEQNDIHSPNVSVYESLLYSAWLRSSPEVDYETRKMFVEEVMELVELTPLRGAMVGLPGVSGGLSTEQRKRLTIAVELVANPSIIFMYAACLFLGFLYTTTVQPIVAIERTVFYRERAAGMYSALPRLLPYIFVQSAMYCVVVYSMIGFEWTVAKFFWWYLSVLHVLLNALLHLLWHDDRGGGSKSPPCLHSGSSLLLNSEPLFSIYHPLISKFNFLHSVPFSCSHDHHIFMHI